LCAIIPEVPLYIIKSYFFSLTCHNITCKKNAKESKRGQLFTSTKKKKVFFKNKKSCVVRKTEIGADVKSNLGRQRSNPTL